MFPVTKAVVGLVSVSVVWQEFKHGGFISFYTNEVFQANTNYEARITLTPAPGYRFTTRSFFYGNDLVKAQGNIPNIAPPNRLIVVQYKPFISSSIVGKFGSLVNEGAGDNAMNRIDEFKDNDSLYITIKNNEDEELTGETVFLAKGNCPANLIIDGGEAYYEYRHTLTVDADSHRSILNIGSGITVTLRNINLKGHADNRFPLLVVGAGGTLILQNVIISGNTNGYGYGGGIRIEGGTVIMNSGTTAIAGNTASYGGGVYNDGGNFIMNSGFISNNKTLSNGCGGGLYHKAGGFSTINVGTISVNTSYTRGGGIFANINNKELTINGGTISGNRADNGGGGVLLMTLSPGAICMMNGGTIALNESLIASHAGGISIMPGVQFIMAGDALIDIDAPDKQKNKVQGVIYVGGTLTQPRVADIWGTYSPGDTVLGGTLNNIGKNNNYTRFLVNGAENKISSTGKYIPSELMREPVWGNPGPGFLLFFVLWGQTPPAISPARLPGSGYVFLYFPLHFGWKLGIFTRNLFYPPPCGFSLFFNLFFTPLPVAWK
jgi:hypothetical protein